jgi:hypothetical protein
MAAEAEAEATAGPETAAAAAAERFGSDEAWAEEVLAAANEEEAGEDSEAASSPPAAGVDLGAGGAAAATSPAQGSPRGEGPGGTAAATAAPPASDPSLPAERCPGAASPPLSPKRPPPPVAEEGTDAVAELCAPAAALSPSRPSLASAGSGSAGVGCESSHPASLVAAALALRPPSSPAMTPSAGAQRAPATGLAPPLLGWSTPGARKRRQMPPASSTLVVFWVC